MTRGALLDLAQYHQRRIDFLAQQEQLRDYCADCWQPDFNCFCDQVELFDPNIEFVILIHPIESKKRVATGRMSYLCLKNARIFRGTGFAENRMINQLANDSSYLNVILSPGEGSTNLTNLSQEERKEQFGPDKKLRVFVLDGTWTNAGKMVYRTPSLQKLPRICFTPTSPSNIRVRKQPHAYCYCTLEAIHHTIGLLSQSRGLGVNSKVHDKMLKPFNWMVEQQILRADNRRNYRSWK